MNTGSSFAGGRAAGRCRSIRPLATVLLVSAALSGRALTQETTSGASPEAPPRVTLLEEVTVTDTREKQEKRETPATVDVLSH